MGFKSVFLTSELFLMSIKLFFLMSKFELFLGIFLALFWRFLQNIFIFEKLEEFEVKRIGTLIRDWVAQVGS